MNRHNKLIEYENKIQSLEKRLEECNEKEFRSLKQQLRTTKRENEALNDV